MVKTTGITLILTENVMRLVLLSQCSDEEIKSREVKTLSLREVKVSKVRPELRSVWLQVVTATQSWPSLSSAELCFFFFFTFLSLFFFFFNLLLLYLLYVILLNTHLFGTSPYFIKSFFLGKKLNGCWDI